MRRIITILVCLGGLSLAACGGIPQDVIGIDGDKISGRDVPDAVIHRIFVAGTRAPAEEFPARFYTRERGKALRFAQVDMVVPPGHEVGKVERPKRLPPNPMTDMVALDPTRLESKPDFVAAINKAMNALPPSDRNVMVFIHGYNTSFDSALFRFAQFVHDTGYTGVPVLFTWPSGGKVLDYVYDINSVLSSRDSLLETFRLLASTKLKRADIVAHSMGNFLTIETLRQAALSGAFKRDNRLRYVVMASPDIDIDVFETQVRAMPEALHKFFVLLSEDDKALAISRRIAGKVNRLGNSTESARLEKIGINLVDLTKVDVKGGLNHAKFADAPDIVQLIGKRLKEGGDALSTERQAPIVERIVKGVVTTATAIPKSVIPIGRTVIVQ